ncbi:alcohol dehydrogenase, putative [Talaromyces stipitatus ATCC 10500]|uniref:Alcohol dehydrogenase, putative n=1 Tax=Talaromyces stipitatus (strain ATCC 10500 / CBS 375.48 / QM 6759 / NRRL 1006) TaxID=441959 RepID=B8MG90_TALSN|nr:alcohol dehydrogenase, putative [Talaromyces stipitatus ATCC 10500]EED16210.1 alcohol dehydrogenase, putative [Talaromyces stipitatus ATCC 10500]
MQAVLADKHIETRALVVEKPQGPFVLHDVIFDEVRDDEVLVEIKYSGLCHTDLVAQQGLIPLAGFPVILGHEGAGIVRRLGGCLKDQSLKVGDHVLLSFSSCMNCSYCAQGQNGLCPQMHAINFTGTRLADGSNPASLRNGTSIRSKFFGQSSFSKLAVVSENSIVKCELSDEEFAIMAPMGCGYLTGAGTVMTVLKPRKQSTLAILGMGAVGLSALIAAKAMGVQRLIAVDILDTKLSLAKSLGATDIVNSNNIESLGKALRELARNGVDHIIDTTGLSFMIEEGINALGHGGSFAIVGAPRPGGTITIDPLDMLRSCKRIVGVVEGASNPATLIPELIRLHREGLFPVERLSRTYSVTDLDIAIEDLKAGNIVKPVLSWESV